MAEDIKAEIVERPSTVRDGLWRGVREDLLKTVDPKSDLYGKAIKVQVRNRTQLTKFSPWARDKGFMFRYRMDTQSTAVIWLEEREEKKD